MLVQRERDLEHPWEEIFELVRQAQMCVRFGVKHFEHLLQTSVTFFLKLI